MKRLAASVLSTLLLISAIMELVVLPTYAEGEATILNHTGWMDPDGYYHILGEIQNTGNAPARFIEVTATFYNSEKNVVGIDFAYSEVSVLLPGRKSPFKIILHDKNQSLKVDHYKVSANCETTVALPKGLEILPSYSNYTDITGRLVVVGEINNTEITNATFVEIIATFYDSAGNVAASDFAYADPYDLQPGETAPFKVVLHDLQRVSLVSSYMLTAQSSEYAVLDEVGTGARHDVAITGINPYRTVVCDRTLTSINVTVANQGSVQETFTLIASYNSTAFHSQMITVGNGSSVKWLVSWNTSGISIGNYSVTVSVDQLPGESDTSDNSLSCTVQVSILGDINGDGKVDMKDVSKVAAGFQTHSGDTRWAANGDLDENGVIDMKDISTIAKHFGEHYP